MENAIQKNENKITSIEMLNPTPEMVVLDIEVFMYDLVVGLYYPYYNKYEFYWNKDCIPILEKLHKNQAPVINFNGNHYDLPILYNYFFNSKNVATAFQLSKYIVEQHHELNYPIGFWNSIDLMFLLQNKVSLKVIEAILGLEIKESSIDFNYEFKLTQEERIEVEEYNKQDIYTSWELYNKLRYHIECRITLANYLNIPHNFNTPLPTLMGMGLKAHRKPHSPIEIPKIVENIPIKHPVKDVFLKHIKRPVKGWSHSFTLGNRNYTIANGGIHSTLKCWSGYDVYHVDVKGYYSLLMMNFDLFSRNVPIEGLEIYKQMYYHRLAVKKENPVLADALKIGILSVWGATKNFHHILYDQYVGELIPLYGQLFLIYLMELFNDNNIEIINSNTDGLIVKGDYNKIKELSDLWCNYGNFEVEIVKYKRFIQKDVNSYILGDAPNPKHLKVKGRDFTAIRNDWLFSNIILIPQVPIVSKLLSEILYHNEENGFDPEGYVRSKIRDYDLKDYLFIAHHTMRFSGMGFVEDAFKCQRTNTLYASENGKTLYKYKGELKLEPIIQVKYHSFNSAGSIITKPGYVMQSELEMFEKQFEKIPDKIITGLDVEPYRKDVIKEKDFIVTPSETSDGQILYHRISKYQYKYPGLPLVKLCNQDLRTVNKETLDINYEWYVDEIMRKYVAYYNFTDESESYNESEDIDEMSM